MALDTVSVTRKILEYVPTEAGITRIEYEGPAIAIYAKNPAVLIYHGYLITEMANKLKKRVIARSEPGTRASITDAREKIEEVVKPHSNVSKVFFDPVKGEVTVYLDTSLDRSVFPTLSARIVSETNWFPLFRRLFHPLSQSLVRVHSANLTFEKERRRFFLSLGDRIFRKPIMPSRDLKLTFLGGVGEIGRSCCLFSTSETKLLIDCGYKPGVTDRLQAFPRLDVSGANLDELDGVVLTHGHLDHSGLIPWLYKHGYRGPVYLTEPTLPLIILLQLDLIEVSKREMQVPPYGAKDVQNMTYHAIPLQNGKVTDISPDVKLTFNNAGHILGSAVAHFHVTDGVHNIVFTGDFKYSSSLLFDRAYTNFTRAESMIIESTYGGAKDVTPSRSAAQATLVKVINDVLTKGGKVLMPVPAVGRAQEILAVLEEFCRSGEMIEAPVFIEGMIEESTAIHLSFPNYLSRKLRNLIANQGFSPFGSEQFVTVHDETVREEAITDGPCVVMATAGMMEGGPVLEYFKHLAGDERNLILFPSYQVPGTRGRRILDGLRSVPLTSEGKMISVNVKARVQRIEGFSAHSDRRELVAYLRATSRLVRNLYVVHGEPDKSLDLARYAKKTFRVNATTVSLLQSVPLK